MKPNTYILTVTLALAASLAVHSYMIGQWLARKFNTHPAPPMSGNEVEGGGKVYIAEALPLDEAMEVARSMGLAPPEEPKTAAPYAVSMVDAMQIVHDNRQQYRTTTALPLILRYAQDRAVDELRNVHPPREPRPFRFQFVLHASGTNWDEAAEMAMDDLEHAAKVLEEGQWLGFGEAFYHMLGHGGDGGYNLYGDMELEQRKSQ